MKADKIPSKSAVSEFYDLEKRLTLTEEEHSNLNNLIIRYDAIKNRYVNQYDDVISINKIAKMCNISYFKLKYAIKEKKLPLKNAIKSAKNNQNLSEIARKHGIPIHTLYARINRYGYPLEKALKLPVRDYKKGKKERKNGK